MVPAYCSVADIRSRLWAGQGSSQPPPDSNLDAYLADLALTYSRKFEHETSRPLGGFTPTYDVRLFSGRGAQMLDVDEFTSISKVEWNSSPTTAPTWVDWTADLSTGKMVVRPLRFWPKRQIFRQQTWIVDPWMNGNVRLTAVFGYAQPDMTLPPPTGQTPPWNGLTDAAIQALAPNPGLAPPACGWWRTPDEVRSAVAEWCVYQYNAGRAGYADQAGHPGGTGALFTKGIPPPVMEVIQNLRGGTNKLAMITLDGADPKEEQLGAEGGIAGDPRFRFAGWHAYDPTGLHPENNW